MERMLLKMARQLNAYDEASLMSLWEKYATVVENFEPSQRWEEAALVFSLIQSVRLKNQLFNQHLAAGAARASDRNLPGMDAAKAWLEKMKQAKGAAGPAGEGAAGKNAASDAKGVGAKGSGSAKAGPEAGGRGKAESKKRCKVLRFSRGKSDKPL